MTQLSISIPDDLAYHVEQLTQSVQAKGIAEVRATPAKRRGPHSER